MGARAFLVIALVVLLIAAGSSGIGAVRRAPTFIRNVIDALVVVAAVRIGLSVALLAFDSTVVNYAIPIAAGLLAAALLFWMRRRERSRQS